METQLFSIGQKIVCIDSVDAHELVEGKTYRVTGYEGCEVCKMVGVFIGIRCIKDERIRYTCSCGAVAEYVPEISYRQTRFVPLDTNDQLEEEIFESLKGVKINSLEKSNQTKL